ncbi:glycosyl hydrolase [Paraburkholderia rhynchosiae]|nr:glycosyl hydrolase [Paraburkholderia rhynchosiae]
MQAVTLTLLAAGCFVPGHANAAFHDPIDTPAVAAPNAAHEPMMSVAPAGKRLVAVGPRGVILLSDDDGAHWRQAPSPVSSDLVSVMFATPQQGWAVGHDGQVLHSADAGATWHKQLDGIAAARLMQSFYAHQTGASPDLKAAQDEAARFLADMGGRPFLDVWFDNDRSGWVVGSFNIIFHTADGGKTWEPWFERVDNPNALNLHTIRRIGSTLYLAGEQGLLLKLDESAQRFVALKTPSKSSFFGMASSGSTLIAYGLLGNAFRTVDNGQTWQKITLPTGASVLASGQLADGRLVLGTQAGELLVSTDQGETFSRLAAPVSGPVFGMTMHGREAILTGAAGLSRIVLPAAGSAK